jgi:two-component system response regulator YesN
MSESHFMSFFKQTTGQSFMAYLNHCRIERAEALLIKTEKSMSEVSQEMGFCDQSYFGTVFRRLVGMTPAAYRRRFRTGEEAPFKLVDHARPSVAPVALQRSSAMSGPVSAQANRPSTALPKNQTFRSRIEA